MPAFTTSQWAILFLVLLLGWLLGLLSRSGGAKWRRAYESEREARVQEQQANAAALATSDARIAELERARVIPVAVPLAGGRPAAAVSSMPSHDDLSRIQGIGSAGQRRLNGEGIYRYQDLVALSSVEEAALEERMGADHGYIEQERWREQAALLAEGKTEEHRALFG